MLSSMRDIYYFLRGVSVPERRAPEEPFTDNADIFVLPTDVSGIILDFMPHDDTHLKTQNPHEDRIETEGGDQKQIINPYTSDDTVARFVEFAEAYPSSVYNYLKSTSKTSADGLKQAEHEKIDKEAKAVVRFISRDKKDIGIAIEKINRDSLSRTERRCFSLKSGLNSASYYTKNALYLVPGLGLIVGASYYLNQSLARNSSDSLLSQFLGACSLQNATSLISNISYILNFFCWNNLPANLTSVCRDVDALGCNSFSLNWGNTTPTCDITCSAMQTDYNDMISTDLSGGLLIVLGLVFLFAGVRTIGRGPSKTTHKPFAERLFSDVYGHDPVFQERVAALLDSSIETQATKTIHTILDELKHRPSYINCNSFYRMRNCLFQQRERQKQAQIQQTKKDEADDESENEEKVQHAVTIHHSGRN